MMTLSYEKPALVSSLPPLKEIIKDGNTGFVFENENSQQLALKVIDVLKDTEQLEQVRRKGAQMMQEKYNWDELGNQTKKVYQNM